MLQLYKNIKDRRLELKMTQSELAKKLGYADKSMIAKIEKGTVDLPQSKIFSFAEALKIDPGDLMGWEESYSEDSAVLLAEIANNRELKELCFLYKELSPEGKSKAISYLKDLIKIYGAIN